MVKHLNTNLIDSVKGNMLRLFQFISTPKEIEGELFDMTLRYLNSISDAMAIKVFSMIVICDTHSELIS